LVNLKLSSIKRDYKRKINKKRARAAIAMLASVLYPPTFLFSFFEENNFALKENYLAINRVGIVARRKRRIAFTTHCLQRWRNI